MALPGLNLRFRARRTSLSIELVGWAAVVLTQVFWIPNIGRIVRTKDVQGYSLAAWAIMFAGLSCWLLYFATKGDVVGMVANICGVGGAGVTLACIWYWGRRREPAMEPAGIAVLGEPLTTDQG